MFSLALTFGVVVFSLTCQTSASGEEVRVVFRNAAGYSSLTRCQQGCAAGLSRWSHLYSVVGESPCDDVQCVCNDRQAIADELDNCITTFSDCYNLNTYNGCISWFGSFCGFEPKLKVYVH